MNALLSAEKPSLLTRYDNLRRKQREVLTATVDTLGKVDGLPEEQLAQARDALFHADHPYLCVLVGAFNTGKSSLINALIGAPVLSVGATPTTNRIAILRYGEALQTLAGGDSDTVFHPSPLLQRVSFVDTPGLDSVFKGHDEATRAFLASRRSGAVGHVGDASDVCQQLERHAEVARLRQAPDRRRQPN
jgi:ribosome biogenesis GTPase A